MDTIVLDSRLRHAADFLNRKAGMLIDGKLVQAASGHRPFRIVLAAVMLREIFGDKLAGEPGRAIDDDVEFRRRHI